MLSEGTYTGTRAKAHTSSLDKYCSTTLAPEEGGITLSHHILKGLSYSDVSAVC